MRHGVTRSRPWSFYSAGGQQRRSRVDFRYRSVDQAGASMNGPICALSTDESQIKTPALRSASPRVDAPRSGWLRLFHQDAGSNVISSASINSIPGNLPGPNYRALGADCRVDGVDRRRAGTCQRLKKKKKRTASSARHSKPFKLRRYVARKRFAAAIRIRANKFHDKCSIVAGSITVRQSTWYLSNTSRGRLANTSRCHDRQSNVQTISTRNTRFAHGDKPLIR